MNLARLVEVWNTGIPVVVLTAQDPFSRDKIWRELPAFDIDQTISVQSYHITYYISCIHTSNSFFN